MTPSSPHHLRRWLLVAAFGWCLAPAAVAADGVTRPPEPAAADPAKAEVTEVQGLLKIGESMDQRKDYHSAEIAFRQALDKAKDQDSIKAAMLGLARTHRLEGNFTKAVALYERLLRDNPDDPLQPDILLELGRAQRAMGASKSALASFYSVINSTLKIPTNLFAHYQLLTKTAQFEIAETHFMAGDYQEAAKFFTRVQLLELAPADRARAMFKSAYAQKLGGDLKGAVITLRAFLEKYPDDDNVPEARYLLSTTLRQLNQPEEALAATLALLKEAQEHDRTNPQNWVYWQRRTGNQLANEFFMSGDTINALAIYQRLVALSAEPTWRLPIMYQCALCYERLRQVDDARKTYEAIVDATKQFAADKQSHTELADLHGMAAWRLQYLAWFSRTDQELTEFFATTTGQAKALPKAAPSPKAPPSAHDTPGNPHPPSASVQ